MDLNKSKNEVADATPTRKESVFDNELVLKIIAFCLNEGKVAARQIAREFGISRKLATKIVRHLETYGICSKSDKKNTPYQLPCATVVTGTECLTAESAELRAENSASVDSVKQLCSALNEIIKENESSYLNDKKPNILNITPTGYFDDRYYYLSELIENFNERSNFQKSLGKRQDLLDFVKKSGFFRYNSYLEEYRPILFYKHVFKRVLVYVEAPGNKFSVRYDFRIKIKHFQFVMRKIIETFLEEK